jgi:hypothetical protein
MWNRILAQYPKAPEAKDAYHQLGPAYEAAGFYDKAASAYDIYNELYVRDADRDLEVRAVCMWEQLGDDTSAAKGVAHLTKAWPKVKVDPDHLCDTVRPIAVP